MTTIEKPAVRPANPHFSSGPCAKIPGWSPELLSHALIGRSHRSSEGKQRLKQAITLTREILEVPDSHLIGIVPASDTGAVEMALWSLLGARPVDLLAWESFGEGWVSDVLKQLKLKDARVLKAPYGELPDLKAIDFSHDVVFTWNGTTSGVCVPDGDWIAADRQGLTICDATSAAFAQALDFAKLDVVTFSWQKVLGGEGAHGVIILSPRAVERLESYVPAWPLPKIFRMTQGGKLIQGIFTGETINTPSMLCVEDYLVALNWARGIGGLKVLRQRASANAAVIDKWIAGRSFAHHLAKDPKTRSNTSVCLTLDGGESVPKSMAKLLEAERAAFDIGAYRDAPPGLRIWCGATVETSDVEALIPWLDWAYAEATR
ncbi:phosphoserine transaminase [Taklimakanibacter albus]|uniref:Phosphoserine transaminase n=1 Tax=Taklimakanibacter albus TaxID=2800327 RepID=A0ACC5R511_9HYPH|nr:phosphoserine transaminase [Aestuariivirga sp. YIM B02566]MBK1867755.1 phosphoserine transaminase [Aestuariivirga sp. YIM B02566]